jgi:regulator of nucleoside diphosphate kinase
MKSNLRVITEPDYGRLRQLFGSAQQRMTHAGELMSLQQELASGQIVPPRRVPKKIVTMNSRVRVRDLRTDESATYTLVYPHEADIEQNKLSVLAPLGRALLGAQMGDTVSFDAPAGRRRLLVEKILYQPEAAGDFHL